jgi:hypothetical protein
MIYASLLYMEEQCGFFRKPENMGITKSGHVSSDEVGCNLQGLYS